MSGSGAVVGTTGEVGSQSSVIRVSEAGDWFTNAESLWGATVVAGASEAQRMKSPSVPARPLVSVMRPS